MGEEEQNDDVRLALEDDFDNFNFETVRKLHFLEKSFSMFSLAKMF